MPHSVATRSHNKSRPLATGGRRPKLRAFNKHRARSTDRRRPKPLAFNKPRPLATDERHPKPRACSKPRAPATAGRRPKPRSRVYAPQGRFLSPRQGNCARVQAIVQPIHGEERLPGSSIQTLVENWQKTAIRTVVRLPRSMLAQTRIHLWEADSARRIPQQNADAKAAPCSAPRRPREAHLQTRGRLKATSGRLTGVWSQGSPSQGQSAKQVQVRGSDGGAGQSCLDCADVRVVAPRDGESGGRNGEALHGEALRCGMAGLGCGASQVDEEVARVTLRPLSEAWPDAFSSSDYVHVSDRYLNSAVESSFVIDLAKERSAREVASIEKFAKARAAGRASQAGCGVEDGVYYEPKVGDYVIGTVASGNYGKLEVDIGARKLAHLFRKDVMPLEICNVREMCWELPEADSLDATDIPGPADGPRYVHDEEVLNLALEVTMPVERGTVFTMEVKTVTPKGVALLSARSVARGYAWQRIRQLNEQNATLEVQITEWTSAGLISKIEGLRAFLPIYNLVNRPPESSTAGTVSYKEYVGQFFSVMIHSIDELKSNLVVSEKKAWVTRNAYIGALVDGIVTDIQPYGVHLRIKDTDLSGVLHISNISRARIDDIGSLFTIGEEVRAMVVPSNIKRRISFSTADLEIEDGLMLRDKEAVYQSAEKIAAEIVTAYRNRNSDSTIDSDDYVDIREQEIVIANWDWLDFGDQTHLD